MAVGSDQPSIHLYLVISGKLVTKLEGHTNRVKGLAVSPEETLLFSASSDGFIRAWSLLDPLVLIIISISCGMTIFHSCAGKF